LKNPFLRISLFSIVFFIILNNFIFYPANILSWDVFGYYLYLPLKFIYNDLGLHNDAVMHSIIEKYHNTATFYQVVKLPEGNFILKYSMGLSFFYFPFFLIGHCIALLFNFPADGFSQPYQFAVFIGGIIYSVIGIIVLAKVLLHFFTEKITAFVLVLIVFSTNYIIHITMYGQNAMSHNYLFTTYAFILWLTLLWHQSHKLKHIIFLAFACGISILSRPSEIVCLLIPLLWGIKDISSLKEKLHLFLKYKKQLILFVIILSLTLSCQMFYWKAQSGSFLFNSYSGNAGEGFEFFNPYIFEVLFSFRKGWLIYTPLMLFAILGFIVVYKKNRAIFYAILVFFVINLYIVSSWSCWWYAGSFSQRSLLQIYPVMAILLGYYASWINEQKKYIRYSGFLMLFLCLLLNLCQTTQFNSGVINGDRMTKDYYCDVFGKFYATAQDKNHLLINRSFDNNESFTNENEYSSRLLTQLDFEKSEKSVAGMAHSGKHSLLLDSSNLYSPAIEAAYFNITHKDHAWIRVTAYVFPVFDCKSNPFSLVIQFNHKERAYKYKAFDAENMKLELNKWNKISFDYLTPEVRSQSDSLGVYFWLRGKNSVYIDDFKTEIFEKK